MLQVQVLLDLVITDIIDLDFAKSRITLNIEFILSWQVSTISQNILPPEFKISKFLG